MKMANSSWKTPLPSKAISKCSERNRCHMTSNRFLSNHWFALSLVALHTSLVGAYAWIELDHAWNDMNATMLVMAGLHIVDYPIHALLQPLFHGTERIGTYLAALTISGGAFWFIVGALLTKAGRVSMHLLARRRPAVN